MNENLHVIKLLRTVQQADNVAFMITVVLNDCACEQCQFELAEERETLQADWRYFFSVN